nr:hypothetical protein [Mycoplasmopsis bovis]
MKSKNLRSLHNFITWKINYDIEALNEEIRTGEINLAMRNPGVLSKVKSYEEKIKGVCLKPMLDYLFYMGYF